MPAEYEDQSVGRGVTSLPGIQQHMVSKQLSSSLRLQPVSRRTEMGGQANAQWTSQHCLRVTMWCAGRVFCLGEDLDCRCPGANHY